MSAKKAFTLIELLVVVAIIGVLSTLAIAYFNKYQQSAYNSIAREAARVLEMGMSAGSDWIVEACSGNGGADGASFRSDFGTCVTNGTFHIDFSKNAGATAESGGYQAKPYWDDMLPGFGMDYVVDPNLEWVLDWNATAINAGTQVIEFKHCGGDTQFGIEVNYNFPNSERSTSEEPRVFSGTCP